MRIILEGTYRTRDGRDVRIYAVDGADAAPVHGAVKQMGEWRMMSWTTAGHANPFCDTSNDLLPAPTKKYRVVIEGYKYDWEAKKVAQFYEGSRVEEYEC